MIPFGWVLCLVGVGRGTLEAEMVLRWPSERQAPDDGDLPDRVEDLRKAVAYVQANGYLWDRRTPAP